MELNLAVVRGPLSSAPDLRSLPSGTEVANLAVRAPVDGKATSVPVTVWDPPAWIAELDAGRRAARARCGPAPLLPGGQRHREPGGRRGDVRGAARQASAGRVHPPDPGVAGRARRAEARAVLSRR